MQKIIKSRKRVRDFGEVFTPAWLVRDMVDLCEPKISEPASKILEPACGNGNFLVEVLARKLARCKGDAQRLEAVASVFGVDILPDNIRECHDRLLNLLPLHLWGKGKEVLARNIVCGDFLNPREIWFLKEGLNV